MLYTMNAQEYKAYMADMLEMVTGRQKIKELNGVINTLTKDGDELRLVATKLKEMQDSLERCIKVSLKAKIPLIKSPDVIGRAIIQKNNVINHILKYTDVGEFYDIDQIIEVLKYDTKGKITKIEEEEI